MPYVRRVLHAREQIVRELMWQNIPNATRWNASNYQRLELVSVQLISATNQSTWRVGFQRNADLTMFDVAVTQ